MTPSRPEDKPTTRRWEAEKDHGFLTPDQVRAIVNPLTATDPVQPYTGFDPDQLANQADHLRAWINGYLSGLATATTLVIAVWILW